MHVAQVNLAYDPRLHDPEALLERYDTLVGWSEALLRAGAACVTVAQRFGGDADVERNGVRYLFRKDGGPGRARAWTRTPRLRRDLAARAPDVVHVNGLMFPLQTWALRRALPRETALVVQDHGGFGPADVSVPAWIWRRSHAGVDAFLFSAATQAGEWRAARLIRPAARIVGIPESGRPQPSLPREEARRRAALPGDPAVLWVGRLNANKDPLTVLDAFAKARGRLPRAALTLVFTEGALEDAVRTRIAATPDLAASVHLRGRVPAEEMPALFAAADLFVLGSRREGSGYALLEALAGGAIPVVTDIPSFRAFTAEGTIGALWPPGDAAACAAALLAMGMGELETRRRAAARHFEEALSWRAVGQRALAAYGEVLARRRGAR